MNKTLDYYLHLPYTRELTPASRGGWVARIKELPDCTSQGDSAEEALQNVETALGAWIKARLADGLTLPEPFEARADDQDNAGQPLQAAALVRQAVEEGLLSDEQLRQQLHQLAHLAIDSYRKGDMAQAKALFDRLLPLFPHAPEGATTTGGRLICEGKLEQAEVSLLRALDEADGDQRGGLYNDLGYLYLQQGRLNQADWALSAALLQEDGKAFLHVAFWVNGVLFPAHSHQLPRACSISLAAFTNQTALRLAQNDVRRAVEVLKTMQVYEQEDLLTLQAWGCVALAQGNRAKAREVWNHALRQAQDPREQRRILAWLELV